MHPRGPSVALLLATLILIMGLIAGCGGGDQSGNQSGDQSGNGSQDGGSGGTKKQDGESAKPEISAPKIALGTIRRVDTEKRRIILRPTSEEQGKKPLLFKVKKKATITLDDKKAEMADAKEGQQAQITYVVKNERNVAREVTLLSPDGAAAGGEELG